MTEISPEVSGEEESSENAMSQPLEDYLISKTLGKGSFGKVKLGIHKLTGEKVAIKILMKDKIYEKTDVERISREIRILKQVKHPFVTQLYEIIELERELYLIMEYAEGGDLFDIIVKKEKLTEGEAENYFTQIILGLQYLHSLGISHRDIKPENILLGEGNRIKIADFGLGNFFKEGEKLQTACGSPCYAPPEMLNKEHYDPQKVDIWSSGILLYVMLHGYLPFEDDTNAALYEKIKKKGFRMASFVSIDFRAVIRGLLLKDPAQRWSIKTIKQQLLLAERFCEHEEIVRKECEQIDVQKLRKICEKLGIVEEARLQTGLIKKKHNNLTTLFYLGKRQIERTEGGKDQYFHHKMPSEETIMHKQPAQTTVEDRHQKEDIIEIMKENHPKSHQNIQLVELQQKEEKSPPKVSPGVAIMEPKPIQSNPVAQTTKPKQSVMSNIPEKLSVISEQIPRKKKSKHDEKPLISEVSKIEPKPLRKNRPMAIQNSKAGKKAPEEIKLYERSHSKDKALILKNTVSQKLSSMQTRTGKIVGTQLEGEIHLLDVDRLVLCSWRHIETLFQGRGLRGSIHYLAYGEDTIYLAECILKDSSAKTVSQQGIRNLVAEINHLA